MDIEMRLARLGLTLPAAPAPVAAYVAGQRSGSLLFVSGQLPIQDGAVTAAGKLGRDLSLSEGQHAARLAALRCLAVVRSHIDNWRQLRQIIRLTGYVQCTEDFYDQPLVLNGASELLHQLMGPAGQHARVAVGVNALPLNACCELEMIVELSD